MAKNKTKPAAAPNPKLSQLDRDRIDPRGSTLTTQQGVEVADNQNSLKAGVRGPTLLEDFFLREKIMHFDHERIPERIVHARGAAAHGVFEVFDDSLKEFTTAEFLTNPDIQTPVFVRFSTVAGSRGSADTVRDVRGFATKFYTQQGNFDLVGNNMPVFFIQDAIKFPDFVHAVKPEPHNEIPQAQSAHDTFWDFVTLNTEILHMLMWAMSDRALPRSYAMMEGFGVHTFRLINAQGVSRFVKFHWKPKLGAHSLAWDETQKIAGKDPDFNRRDLWESIESGQFPEWELGLQIVEEADADNFDFDLLDPTKIIPEELVPVRRVGRMVLNRNPDNFFAETEQVAYCIANIVPGIDFTNDPLLQGRLFSYLDTQLTRLGGPNFAQIPINKPVCPVRHNQRDGFHQHQIVQSRTSYEPNSISGGCPAQSANPQAFRSYAERIDAASFVRQRSESFQDHFTQASLFYASQSEAEKRHLAGAISFELSKVGYPHIRERVIALLANIDEGLAGTVARKIGITEFNSDISYLKEATTASLPNDKRGPAQPGKSAALSLENQPKASIETRRIALLVAPGFDGKSASKVKSELEKLGAIVAVIGPHLGPIPAQDGGDLEAKFAAFSVDSVLFDGVVVAGGQLAVEALARTIEAREFVLDSFRHCKLVATLGQGETLLQASGVTGYLDGQSDPAVLAYSGKNLAGFVEQLVAAIASHRNWDREQLFMPE